MISAAILTVSDTRTKDNDTSGKTLCLILETAGVEIRAYDLVVDDQNRIAQRLVHYADELGVDVVLTTGGTGLSPRDVTPEATLSVVSRHAPGIAEFIRFRTSEKTPRAALSCAVAGIRNATLIVNLPGSPRAVEESMEVFLPLLSHAVGMMRQGGH